MQPTILERKTKMYRSVTRALWCKRNKVLVLGLEKHPPQHGSAWPLFQVDSFPRTAQPWRVLFLILLTLHSFLEIDISRSTLQSIKKPQIVTLTSFSTKTLFQTQECTVSSPRFLSQPSLFCFSPISLFPLACFVPPFAVGCAAGQIFCPLRKTHAEDKSPVFNQLKQKEDRCRCGCVASSQKLTLIHTTCVCVCEPHNTYSHLPIEEPFPPEMFHTLTVLTDKGHFLQHVESVSASHPFWFLSLANTRILSCRKK